jgi:hypothetical protein
MCCSCSSPCDSHHSVPLSKGSLEKHMVPSENLPQLAFDGLGAEGAQERELRVVSFLRPSCAILGLGSILLG